MKIILIGLLISTDASRSVAAFHVDGKLALRRMGQNIGDLGRLEWIEHRTLYIAKDAKLFTMRAGDENAAEQTAPKLYRYIERKGDEIIMTEELRAYISGSNLASTMMEAASEAVTENGAVIGFKLFDFDKDSIFALAGIQDGDVVMEVGGRRLDGALSAVRALLAVKDEREFTILIRRNGLGKLLNVLVK